jgi:hypothetical protein
MAFERGSPLWIEVSSNGVKRNAVEIGHPRSPPDAP